MRPIRTDVRSRTRKNPTISGRVIFNLLIDFRILPEADHCKGDMIINCCAGHVSVELYRGIGLIGPLSPNGIAVLSVFEC